jgi:hypothetical protein
MIRRVSDEGDRALSVALIRRRAAGRGAPLVRRELLAEETIPHPHLDVEVDLRARSDRRLGCARLTDASNDISSTERDPNGVRRLNRLEGGVPADDAVAVVDPELTPEEGVECLLVSEALRQGEAEYTFASASLMSS